MGGAIPYLAERLDRGFEALEQKLGACGAVIERIGGTG